MQENPDAIKVAKRRLQKVRRSSNKVLKTIHQRTEDASESDDSLSNTPCYDNTRPELPFVHKQMSKQQGTFQDPHLYGSCNAQLNSLEAEQEKDNWEIVDELTELIVDSDSDAEEDLHLSLRNKLSQWAVYNNVSLSALTQLLKILKQHDIDVPVDGRTLLKTPRSGTLETKKKSGDFLIFFLLSIHYL